MPDPRNRPDDRPNTTSLPLIEQLQALENDAATSGLADRIRIATIGGTVVLRGTVDTLDDGDALVEVASRVSGVDEVRDETDFPGL